MKTSVLISLIFLMIFGIWSCKDEYDTGTISYNGYNYKTVKIGSQWWFAENLQTTQYNNGTSISNITDWWAWRMLTTDAYCWYNNNETTYRNLYGALYNWYAVKTGKLCPSGWHVPSNEEWTILSDYLGDGNVAGGKMKERGTIHWASPNEGATNESGFSGLPGGNRYYGGGFESVGETGSWWSLQYYYTELADYWSLVYSSPSLSRSPDHKGQGFSVRCIKE
jgi:uncharacterized protein (TIGR02145 family)